MKRMSVAQVTFAPTNRVRRDVSSQSVVVENLGVAVDGVVLLDGASLAVSGQRWAVAFRESTHFLTTRLIP